MSLPETTSFCEVETKKNSFHPQWITSCLLNKLEVFGSAGIPINLHPSPLCPSLHHPRAPNTPFSVFFFFFLKMRVKNNNTSLIPNSSRRFSPDPPHFALRPLSHQRLTFLCFSPNPSFFLPIWTRGGGWRFYPPRRPFFTAQMSSLFFCSHSEGSKLWKTKQIWKNHASFCLSAL